MINDTGSRKLAISHIEISGDLTPPVKRFLMAHPAMLKDAGCLTLEAIQTAAIQAPPIVYEKIGDNGQKTYHCIGNLRTLFLAKMLGNKITLRSTVVEKPKKTHADSMAMSLFLSKKSCFLVNPENSARLLIDTYLFLSSKRSSVNPTVISPTFKTKKAFLEAFNINRRIK